ncbi:hypothetical protein ACFZDK_24765 [Streptomyces sp. NPDC007901]|uniref:hypothetical protein n=1 Tax=Streptomyces sp. NPDC007901 TaxID=3364785 RepID=UPI0036EFB120
MTREHRLTMANAAATRAAGLARQAQAAAEKSGNAADLAAAGSLWALVAQAHAGIANLLPQTTKED